MRKFTSFGSALAILLIALSCASVPESRVTIKGSDADVMEESPQGVQVSFREEGDALIFTYTDDAPAYLILRIRSDERVGDVAPVITVASNTYRTHDIALAKGTHTRFFAFKLFTNTITGESLSLSNGVAFAFSFEHEDTRYSLTNREWQLFAEPRKAKGVSFILTDARLSEKGPMEDPRPKSILPNGGFTDLKNDGTPLSWTGFDNDFRFERQGAENNVLVTKSDSTNTFRFISNIIELDPNWLILRFSCRMKTENQKTGPVSWYHTGRVKFQFFDEKMKPTRMWRNWATRVHEGRPAHEFGDWKGFPSWTTLRETVTVDKGAKYLLVMVGLQNAKGTFFFDDISVIPEMIPYADASLPEGETIYWGKEPIVTQSRTREEILLNGIWKICPAIAIAEFNPPPIGWGYARVPGSVKKVYQQHNNFAVIAPGVGNAWNGWEEESRFWYRREVTIPKTWTKGRYIIHLDRVSTDALISVNGKRAGRITWPCGDVDITEFAKPGEKVTLDIYVYGITEEFAFFSMGVDAGTVSKAQLGSTGLIGDVYLRNRPGGAHVDGVWVKTSTRKWEVMLDTEITNVIEDDEVAITCHMENHETGEVEKTFRTTARIEKGEYRVVSHTWAWDDPRLWDWREPNLYIARVEVKGAHIDDVYAQRFGFREFWVEGKDIYMNNRLYAMRPIQGRYFADIPTIDGVIKGFLQAGFNAYEFWPGDVSMRGRFSSFAWLYDRADLFGMPVFAEMASMGRHIIDRKNLTKARWTEESFKKYAEEVALDVKRYRNHPSIVMWVTTANTFAHNNDQNPRFIGRSNWLPDEHLLEATGGEMDAHTKTWLLRYTAGMRGINYVKKVDPTRNIFSHSGTYVGDIYGPNCYLGLLPLQEREEWLSYYAEHGTMPLMPVEFGCPLTDGNFNRARGPFGFGVTSEPLVTEHTAAFLGEWTYHHEPEPYYYLVQNFAYTRPNRGKWYFENQQGCPYVRGSHRVNLIVARDVRNMWRSWRTWGNSAGRIPWDDADAFHEIKQKPDWWNYGRLLSARSGYWGRFTDYMTNVADFTPGTKGVYVKSIPIKNLYTFQEHPKAHVKTPSGYSFLSNNSVFNAWIAGNTEHFTEKGHAFFEGETVEKQVVLINDTRAPQRVTAKWNVRVGGNVVETFTANEVLDEGEVRKIPFTFTCPNVRAFKTEGKITLVAQMTDTNSFSNAYYAYDETTYERHDGLPFRVFKAYTKAKEKDAIAIFDPVGETREMLTKLGYTTVDIDTNALPPVIVIGKRAMEHAQKLPFDALLQHVRTGGSIVLCPQHPDWLRRYTGTRVARWVLRQFFLTQEEHPIVNAFDARDLEDWRGTSTLVNPTNTYYRGNDAMVIYGWRWGNRGGVSSAAIEKPHHAGWKSIIEGAFDLSYSPLMELAHGKGKIIWSQLDLEERALIDPVPTYLARNIIDYAFTPGEGAKETSKTVYIGGEYDKALLDAMDLVDYEAKGTIDFDADLIIVGKGADIDERLLESYTMRGGSVFFMQRTNENAFSDFGVKLRHEGDFFPEAGVPKWDVCEGVSISETHWRSHHETWPITEGARLGAGGLLGYKRKGDGRMIFLQCDPRLMYDGTNHKKILFRYTQWRMRRLLSLLIANMGGVFHENTRVFRPAYVLDSARLSLAGTWKRTVTHSYPSAKSPGALKDPGISDEALAFVKKDVDVSSWDEIPIPTLDGAFGEQDGEAVYRTTVIIPKELAGREIILCLGAIDDFDDTYWNGERVGQTTEKQERFWVFKRRYVVPARLVKEGENVLAVRVFDWFGGGGFGASVDEFFIEDEAALEEMRKDLPHMYHPDYLSTKENSMQADDPFRYVRW